MCNDALFDELVLHLGRLQRLDDLAVEFVADGGGRFGRQHHALPRRDFEAGQCFGHRRQFGQQRIALRAGGDYGVLTPSPVKRSTRVEISLLGSTQERRIHARGEFSENTARLSGWRTGDIVADSQKWRLNFLFALRLIRLPFAPQPRQQHEVR